MIAYVINPGTGGIKLACASIEPSLNSALPGQLQLDLTRAELALIDLEMEQGKLTPADAVVRLERLRFAWRGDDLEPALAQPPRQQIAVGVHVVCVTG